MENKKPSPSINAPELSVVIASDHAIREADRCLKALLQQTGNEKIELIVADSRSDDSLQEIMTKYPGVEFIRFPEKTPLPMLLGAGIARSRGGIVAVTDATCVADSNWIAATLKAHQSSHPVIGGAVEAAEGKNMVDWAAYFCEYGQFMRPLLEGPAEVLSGNNISFKRWTLTKGQEFVQNRFWKTYWCRRLQEEGIQLVSTPSMVIYDHKSYRLIPFLIRRFHHGRCFAGMRVSQVSAFRRAAYFASSPLLPLLFLARTISSIVSKRRHLKQFILSLPISILAIMVWSLGEFCGYLAGAGESCASVY
ncbi:MAG: glycosyltransferase [Pyrinomonadaceae bacterium]